jgi:uncharacterized protein YkwD
MKIASIATLLICLLLAGLAAPFVLRPTRAGELPAASTATPALFLPVAYHVKGIAPSPTASPTATLPPQPGWLASLNAARALGSLPSVSENTAWSSGCGLHARYMVKNDVIEHSENPANPWYTPEGLAAAQNGNLMVSSSTSTSDQYAIDLWLTGPFHGVGLLDPALLQSGYGSYREADGGWQMGACLDVLRGLGAIPPAVTFPVRWPQGQMPYRSFGGTEYPDPLTSCPGYTAPSGPPLYLQIGSGSLTPSVSAHSFRRDGTSLEHCLFDETSYINPDASAQSLARSILNSRDAIVLIPRQPLTSATTYTVSITANGQVHTWSFTTGSAAAPQPGEEGVEYYQSGLSGTLLAPH